MFLFSQMASAQENLFVTELNYTFSVGNKPTFLIAIPQATMKATTSDWKSYLKSNSKRSASEKSGEITLPNGPILNVCTDSVTIYSVVTSDGINTKLYVSMMQKDSSFVSSQSNQEKANALSYFVRQFGVLEYRNAVNLEITAEQKKQKVLEEKVEDIEKANEKLRSKIGDNERFIDRKKDDIKMNEADQELKNKAITEQKIVISHGAPTKELLQKEEKKLKELTKDKEHLQDDKDSMLEKISEKESENRSFQKQIDQNLEEAIPAAKAEVQKQKAVVAAAQTKLSNIK